MISQLTLQEQDVWEAWVDFDPCSATQFGTLYITGDVAGCNKAKAITEVRQTHYGPQLVIQMPPRQAGRSRLREFFYSEPIGNPAQYHSICVYAGSDLLARFRDIEIMIS